MPDVLVTDNLQDIISSIELIEQRFKSIAGADDFVLSETGMLILDSIYNKEHKTQNLKFKIQDCLYKIL